ncbi:MAG TPA: hypothetical protein VL527_07440 [Dongiaceae bacterium]|jgi:hypothetical protein|nr:hypothetical protein [Dongiaceae bacterium]
MRDKKLDHLIQQLETYLECWKQFNRFIGITRTKKFGPEDEQQFLEIKSVIVQELEVILSIIETGTPTREEIHSLISGAPSLRSVGDMSDGALRGLENQWHKIYIGWHSVLGQLKVRQRQLANQSAFSGFFGKKGK